MSVVIRSREGEDLSRTIESIRESSIGIIGIEIIVVSFSNSFSECIKDGIHIISCNVNRIEAKLIGIHYSKSNKIMFIDSDQTVAVDLIPKIIEFDRDMGIIPERSLNTHFMARLLDSKRSILEKRMREAMDIVLPVVPRVFSKVIIERALNSLGEWIRKNVTEFEDSLIFYEVVKFSKDIGWINSYIYNIDPKLKEFVMKSFHYGLANAAVALSGELSEEYVHFIQKIQFETLVNNRIFSLRMLLENMTRGIPFILGEICIRFKGGIRK